MSAQIPATETRGTSQYLHAPIIPSHLTAGLVSFAVVTLAIAIGLGLLYGAQFGMSLSDKGADWNNFGTYFGGTVGPVLGYLSFVGVLITIGLQYILVAETRRQVAIAATTSERQSALLSQQAFEATFFQMIRLRDDHVQSIRYFGAPLHPETVGGGHTGRSAFEAFVRTYLNNEFAKVIRGDFRGLPPEEHLRRSFRAFLEVHGQEFWAYLRITVELLDLIDGYGDQTPMERLKESFRPDGSGVIWEPMHCRSQEKLRYANIALAPLTYYEDLALGLFACSDAGSTQASSLVERFGVLRHVPHSPHHLADDEFGPEQQAIYAMHRMYRKIAFQMPKVGS
jgi:hypothetical protein